MFLRSLPGFGRSSLPASPHFGPLSRQPVWIDRSLASPTASTRETGRRTERGQRSGGSHRFPSLPQRLHPPPLATGKQVMRSNPRRGLEQGVSTQTGAGPSQRLPACGRDHEERPSRALPASGLPGRGQECLWSQGLLPLHEEQHLRSHGWNVPEAVSSLLSSLFCRKSEPECPGWRSPCPLEGGGLRPRRPQGA